MLVGNNAQFDFKTVPIIRFANDAALNLAEQLQQFKVNAPLIVTDVGIVALGLMNPTLAKASAHSIKPVIYSDVVADPPESIIQAALEVALTNGCDSVVGFGGGSSMDVAKLVAVLIKQEQRLQDIYGVDKIHSSRVPLIQIPTTAGTGSEATNVAIVTTGEFTKAGVVSERLFADAILLDPLLTIGLPPHVTAATGIDAMVHAIEAFTSKRLKNSMSDMFALKALTLMSASIKTVVKDGRNVGARSDMLLGAMMAGQAFANAPVAAVHALAYPLGGIYHIPHGLSNSLVLPHVLRFNGFGADDLYADILTCIDFTDDHATVSSGDKLASYFVSLASDLGLQTRLREFSIMPSDLPQLAENAMLQERLLINNPRQLSYDQVLGIYQKAY